MKTKPSPLLRWRATISKPLREAAPLLGVNYVTLSRWEKKGVPIKRLGHVEKVTGIPKEELRPDIFEGVV